MIFEFLADNALAFVSLALAFQQWQIIHGLNVLQDALAELHTGRVNDTACHTQAILELREVCETQQKSITDMQKILVKHNLATAIKVPTEESLSS